MTRITLIASGTRGDVQPSIAVGVGLRDAGYRVRVLAGSSFRGWIESRGLEAAPSRVDMQAVMASPAGRAWVQSGHKPLQQQRLMKAIVADVGDDLIRDAAEAAADADLLLSGFTSDAYALAIGEHRGIPVASLPLQPTMLRTRDGRAMTVAPMGDRVSRLNALFGRLILEPVGWRMYGEAVNRFRRSLGLQAQTAADHLVDRRRMPMLHGVSRHVLPLPADWPSSCHVTGYWFLDEDAGWAPSPAVEAFLADGPAPVSIGFGSMTGGDPAETAALVLEAVRLAGVRAVLLSGWGGFDAAALPPSVLVLDEAPHAWLFPRVAAVVHHGGAGPNAAAFRAGVPQVVVPHMADQPYWGRRVVALGAGPRPLPRHKLTAEGLAAALRAATGDAAMRARAGELATAIRAEDGVAEAVRLVRGIVAP
jgi:UDP:flavonoid glycosyltransferase YjiC (YdhE family)